MLLYMWKDITGDKINQKVIHHLERKFTSMFLLQFVLDFLRLKKEI